MRRRRVCCIRNFTVAHLTMDEEKLIEALPRLEKAKEEANVLYRERRFKDAARAYTRLVAEMLEKDSLSANIAALTAAVKDITVKDEGISKLLATLLSNAALCYYQEQSIDEASKLWDACLAIDAYNYKAVYNLAQCCVARREMKKALELVARCQNIALTKGMNNTKSLPHAELMQRIGSTVEREYDQRQGFSGNDEIFAAIEADQSVRDNLEKLSMQSRSETARNRVIPRLIKVIKGKTDVVKHATTHADTWGTIHVLLQDLESGVEAELLSQLSAGLSEHSLDLLRYAKDLMKAIENNRSAAKLLYTVAFQFGRVCYHMGTTASLEALCTIVEGSDAELEQRIYSCVYQYFSRPRHDEKRPVDGHFTTVLTRILETMLGQCELGCPNEKRDTIERVLVSIFVMAPTRFAISEETLNGVITRLLGGYIAFAPDPVLSNCLLQSQWYMAMRCLHVSNKAFFKEYMLTGGLVTPLIGNFMIVGWDEPSMSQLRLYMSEVIVFCMDYMELRQQIVDTKVNEKTLLEFLRHDVNLAKFLSKLIERDAEVEEYCRKGKYEFKTPLRSDSERSMHEFKLLILSKLAVHSTEVMRQICEAFEIMGMVPLALVANLIDGYRVDLLIDSLSYLTLHGEAKEDVIIDMILPVLRWAESSTECKDRTFYMVCQTLANLTRSRSHRDNFNRDPSTGQMFDEAQISALREAYEKLPAASRPKSNGEYDEGSDELAERSRKALLCLHEDVPRLLINLARKASPDNANTDESESGKNAPASRYDSASHLVMMETLHNVTAPRATRGKMQTVGALRVFLNASINDAHMKTKRSRYFTQSVAHLCMASDPRTLSYRDALDAAGPLVKLLRDDNELLQYEAALGLTNLLAVDDSVRQRVWTVGGWDALGALLSSDNALLKAAGLEGWCNFANGSGSVNSHIYRKLSDMLDDEERRISRENNIKKSDSSSDESDSHDEGDQDREKDDQAEDNEDGIKDLEDEDNDEAEEQDGDKVEDDRPEEAADEPKGETKSGDAAESDPLKKVPILQVHDVNVMLMFAADTSDLRCVKASAGALAHLTNDVRVAGYLPLCSKFDRLIVAADSLEDRDALQRVFTVFNHVQQGHEVGDSAAREYVAKVKRDIRACTERNMPKMKACGLLDLAEEVLQHSDITDNSIA
ncbi:tetratricopeptide repeat-containing protein, putative [Babesia ovata]|uniref:Tetratricopeptide repeat-containing protein, putative n=1 Tax=Babesia ovata TaxID=189622 RepID=A0A2H6KFU2_9APIC|nr:tetratricopeptide repeat-containing protein, putative [Babesia ovata]GBE61862.1 tetratricopeptide repeat-containing protein, putative [Babesia ovata]